MKLLGTTAKPARTSIISNALHAITTSISSLLIWTKMLFIVGFVIIGVVILGALLGVLVRICNYRNGTEYRTGQILKDLLTYLWSEAIEKTKKKWNSQKSS
jgi:uncharacterized membrane protein YgaE (UPF0421/DUF939 family)